MCNLQLSSEITRSALARMKVVACPHAHDAALSSSAVAVGRPSNLRSDEAERFNSKLELKAFRPICETELRATAG